MKTAISIFMSILFWTVCFVPSDDAPLSAFFIWAVYCVCVIIALRIVGKALEEWDED